MAAQFVTKSSKLVLNGPKFLSKFKQTSFTFLSKTLNFDNFSRQCGRTIQSPRCSLSTSATMKHDTDPEVAARPDTINVVFITKDGEPIKVKGREGECCLYLAHRKGVDMEGACEASLACTTCHVYVESEDEHWDKLGEATETEEDLLDMAPFLAPNSRLGCQIILSKDIDGITLRLPRATKNFYVDGHKPQPH